MSTCKIDVSSWDPKQFEIEFFFPLTEQIPLDLDFNPCKEYAAEQQRQWLTGSTGTVLMSSGTGLTWAVPNQSIAFIPSNDSVGYWKVGEGIQMHNKKKPNWLHQLMSKVFFGWKWEDK